MKLSPRLRRSILMFAAALLVGSSLWLTWHSASTWAPCAGADWTNMNPACAEAMSSYSVSPVTDLWFALVAVVVALVVGRVSPRRSAGVAAIITVCVACPLLDPGFFWVPWGTADGVPGSGLWTAAFIAAAGIILLAPVPVSVGTGATHEAAAPSTTS